MRKLFVICILIFLSVACAERRPVGPDETGNPAILPSESVPPSPPSSMFPHPDGWESPSSHGAWVVQFDSVTCLKCHKISSDKEETPPTCNSCHPLFPHMSDWAKREIHGAKVLSDGKGSCATQCHGTDLKGGLSGISCNDCHTIYPHEEGWSTSHGATALASNKAACQNCHGVDFKKIVGGKNCFSCHFNYPHLEGWVLYAGGHGEKIKTSYGGSASSCQLCHGADLKTLKNGKNCFSCHASYPHNRQSPSPWGEYGQHGEYTLSPEKKVECQLCHGSDYKGGSRGNPSCFSCHTSYPHLAGWARPSGEPQEHAGYVGVNGTGSCATSHCHGVGLVWVSGTTKGPDCNYCHESYPHPPNWAPPVLPNSLHGLVARAEITGCKGCHHATLDFAPPGKKGCKECHESYLKHETAEMGVVNWGTFDGHGKYVKDHGWNFDECKLCHGDDYSGGVSGVPCGSCHPDYPHPANWGQAAVHGPKAYGTLKDNCDSAHCHKPDFTGDPPTVDSCKDAACHSDFPHNLPNWVAGISSVHATTFIERMDGDGIDDDPIACQECHGAGYNRVVPAAPTLNCTSCHSGGVTHTTGWSTGSGHGTYFSSIYNSTATTPCQDCHGHPNLATTFIGGQTKAELVTQSDCYTCHWAYPHTVYDNSAIFGVVSNWAPASNDIAYWGHAMYAMFGNLLIDSTGIQKIGGNDPCLIKPRGGDPTVKPILQNSCGGETGGQCHSSGYRSPSISFSTLLCGGYCHSNVTTAGTCP